jgi:CheY-like chemotaxis protein
MVPARILIIADDGASLKLAKYLLQSAGYGILTARDGETGLRLARNASPDAVICYMRLPRMTGYELVRALHASPTWHGAPLIAVTASSMAGDRERTLAAGFDGYLSKSITAKTFVGEIESFLPVKCLARRK